MIKDNIIKYSALFFGLIEMLCFSGILFGLNSLYEYLRKEKLFVEYCNNTSNSSESKNKTSEFCADQNTFFGYILITTMVSQCLLAYPLGFLFDKYGQKRSKICVSIIFLFACNFFAISFRVSSYLVFSSAILFGISAQMLLFGNLALGKLIPKFQNIIVSTFSGSFDTSSVILTFFALTHKHGASLFTSFLSLGFSGFLFMLCNALFIVNRTEKNNNKDTLGTKEKEDNNIQNSLLKDSKKEILEIDDKNEPATNSISFKSDFDQGNKEKLLENGNTDTLNIQKKIMEELQNYTNELYPNFKSIFFTRYYLFQLGFFTILYFRFTFSLVQLSLQLQHNFSDRPELIGKLLSDTNYFFLCGIAFSIIVGIIVDLSKKICFTRLRESNKTNRELHALTMQCFVAPQLICCICNLTLSVTIMIPHISAVYVTYLCITITRAFLFSLNSAYLLQAFPIKFFGQTLGVTSFIAGIVSFVQYALLFKDLYYLNIVNYVLIVFSCLNFLHPLILLFAKN